MRYLLPLLLTLTQGALAAGAEVVVVVSAESPVSSLTDAQIANIFLGKTSRFPEGERAVPLDLPEGSPAREELYLKLAGKDSAQMKAHWSRIIFTGRGQPPSEVASAEVLKQRLAENPSAIGYLDSSMVDDSLRVLGDTARRTSP